MSNIDFQAKFKGYVQRSIQLMLERVQQAQDVLLSEERAQATHILSYAFKLPEAWSDTRQLLCVLAPQMEQAGHRDEWIPYLEQGIHYSLSWQDTETEAELSLHLGILYERRGQYDLAQAQLRSSIQQFDILNRPQKQAQALNRLAFVARQQHQFEPAIRAVETALDLLPEHDNERAYSYLVLGSIELGRRNWPKAVDFLKESLRLWEGQHNSRMLGRCLISLGAALRPQQKYAEAVAAYQRAITLFEQIQDPVQLAIAQMNLGNVYLSQQQPTEALAFYRPAEQVFRQVQDRFHLAHINHNIGLAYRSLRQYERAAQAYLLSLEQQQALGNIAFLVDTLDGLGLAYLAQGRSAEAIVTFERALTHLTEIKGESWYEHLFERITGHLAETRTVSGQQNVLSEPAN